MEFITQIPLNFWVTVATIIVNILLAQLSKKYTNISPKLIPLQTALVGIIVCIIEYIITKDFNTALVLSGVMSGGTYDLGKAFKSLFAKKEDEE